MPTALRGHGSNAAARALPGHACYNSRRDTNRGRVAFVAGGGPMPGKTRKKGRAAPLLLRRLRKHFDADPADLPVVEQPFDLHDRPNLHLAVEELLGGPGRSAELVGVLARDEYRSPSLGRLSRESAAKLFEPGPVEHVDVPLPGGR